MTVETAELSGDANLGDRLDSLMDILGPDDEGDAPEEESADEGDLDGDPAPAEQPTSEDDQTQDEGENEPADKPTIELPASIPAELRQRLKDLDPETQRAIAKWESERHDGNRQKLEASAKEKQAIEAERQAIATERQRAAQTIAQAIQLSAFDPVLAEGLKMTPADWATLAHEDKATFLEKRADFDARVATVNSAIAERDRLQAAAQNDHIKAEQQSLLKAMPELADPKKAEAFGKSMNATLADYGFSPQDIKRLTDHRMILVLRDAIAGRAAVAARKAAAGKVASVPARTIAPGRGTPAQTQPRKAGLLKTIRGGGSLHDQANALAAYLDD